MAPPSTKSPNIGLGILLPNYDDPAEDVLFNHPDIPLPLDSGGTLHTFGMSNRARSPNPGALYLHLRRERKRAIMSPTLVTSAAEFATQTPLLQAPSLLTPTISSPVSLAYGSPLLSTSRLTTPVVTSSPVFSSTHATQHAAPSSQVPTSSVNYVAITLALSMTLGVVVAVCTVGIAFLIWRRRKADSNRPHGGSSAKMGGGSKLSRVSDASLDGKMASKELNNQVALRSVRPSYETPSFGSTVLKPTRSFEPPHLHHYNTPSPTIASIAHIISTPRPPPLVIVPKSPMNRNRLTNSQTYPSPTATRSPLLDRTILSDVPLSAVGGWDNQIFVNYQATGPMVSPFSPLREEVLKSLSRLPNPGVISLSSFPAKPDGDLNLTSIRARSASDASTTESQESCFSDFARGTEESYTSESSAASSTVTFQLIRNSGTVKAHRASLCLIDEVQNEDEANPPQALQVTPHLSYASSGVSNNHRIPPLDHVKDAPFLVLVYPQDEQDIQVSQGSESPDVEAKTSIGSRVEVTTDETCGVETPQIPEVYGEVPSTLTHKSPNSRNTVAPALPTVTISEQDLEMSTEISYSSNDSYSFSTDAYHGLNLSFPMPPTTIGRNGPLPPPSIIVSIPTYEFLSSLNELSPTFEQDWLAHVLPSSPEESGGGDTRSIEVEPCRNDEHPFFSFGIASVDGVLASGAEVTSHQVDVTTPAEHELRHSQTTHLSWIDELSAIDLVNEVEEAHDRGIISLSEDSSPFDLEDRILPQFVISSESDLDDDDDPKETPNKMLSSPIGVIV